MNNKLMIKVCGMRDAENIRAVEQLGVDWMGFIFWPKSKRYVSERPAYLPTKCKRVGVFVDEDIDRVLAIAAAFRLDILQLHGNESPTYLRTLHERLAGDGFPVAIRLIKAFNIATAADLAQTKPYEALADYFLFDTKVTATTPPLEGRGAAAALPGASTKNTAALPGGSGQQFDWSILSAYDGTTPFLLSGGIGPDDAPSLHQAFALDGFPVEHCLGIDLNSRFESAPALKDTKLLQEFLKALNNE